MEPLKQMPLARETTIVIDRRDVFRQRNWRPLSAQLSPLVEKNDMLAARYGKYELAFTGFDDDPEKPLWCRKGVCELLRNMNQAWPNWLFFLNPQSDSFVNVSFCVTQGNLSHPKNDSVRYWELKNFFQFCMRFHDDLFFATKMPVEKRAQMMEQVALNLTEAANRQLRREANVKPFNHVRVDSVRWQDAARFARG